MCDGRYNTSETNPVGQRKEHTEVYMSLLFIGRHVDFELVVDDGRDIIYLAIVIKQVFRENREVLGIVQVESPIGSW